MKKAVAKTIEKYVTEKTFEKVMEGVAKTLANQDRILIKISNTLATIQEDNKEFRKRVYDSEMILSHHDKKIENLLVRVEKLESKVK